VVAVHAELFAAIKIHLAVVFVAFCQGLFITTPKKCEESP
jgi:hypothetical protein